MQISQSITTNLEGGDDFLVIEFSDFQVFVFRDRIDMTSNTIISHSHDPGLMDLMVQESVELHVVGLWLDLDHHHLALI